MTTPFRKPAISHYITARHVIMNCNLRVHAKPRLFRRPTGPAPIAILEHFAGDGCAGAARSSDERAAFLSLAALFAPLQSAIGDRPFGDAEAVRTAARDAVGQFNRAIAGLQDKRWHAQESRRLIEQICRARALQPLDYDSGLAIDRGSPSGRGRFGNGRPRRAARPISCEDKNVIEELSRLIGFPPGPYSALASASGGTTLWRNGSGFDSDRFSPSSRSLRPSSPIAEVNFPALDASDP